MNTKLFILYFVALLCGTFSYAQLPVPERSLTHEASRRQHRGIMTCEDKRSRFPQSVLKNSSTASIKLDSAVTVNALGVKMYKDEYIYDGNGNRTLVIYYTWDTAADNWAGSSKYEYTYDSNGNLTLWVYYNWDSANNNWISRSKYEYAYDGNGNLTLGIYYTWNIAADNWAGSSKSEYTYEGNLTLEIVYTWNTGTINWEGYSKYEYTYDGNGNPALVIYYTWDSVVTNWAGRRKYEYTYDGNGNLTLMIGYTWSTVANNWTESSKYEYTYDGNGNPTLIIYYTWDSTATNWARSSKVEYTYDCNYFVSDLCTGAASLFSSWINNNIPLEKKEYEWNSYSENWESTYGSIETCHYSAFNASGIANTRDDDFNIYPNPVKDILKIKTNADIPLQVKLYDMQGRQILATDQSNLELSACRAGMYIVDVNGVKIKIVKQ